MRRFPGVLFARVNAGPRWKIIRIRHRDFTQAALAGGERLVANGEPDLRMNLSRSVHSGAHTLPEIRPVLAKRRQLAWKLYWNLVPPDHGEDHDVAQSKSVRERGDRGELRQVRVHRDEREVDRRWPWLGAAQFQESLEACT